MLKQEVFCLDRPKYKSKVRIFYFSHLLCGYNIYINYALSKNEKILQSRQFPKGKRQCCSQKYFFFYKINNASFPTYSTNVQDKQEGRSHYFSPLDNMSVNSETV